VATDEYVYSQLIPYIGNKRKLLGLIGRALASTGIERGTFVDLFTGSTVVARYAKELNFRVVANDWEPYSYEIARGTVALNREPRFKRLGAPAPEELFAELSSLPPVHGWVAQHLCPTDDENPDPETERMFFTRRNGEMIDAIREKIADWQHADLIDGDERAYLLAPLMYAVSYASNTSGVFKGFHRGWGGKTGTALYRIRGDLVYKPPILFDNGQPNLATRGDAHEVVREITSHVGSRPDIVYLDPPYNQHPYGSNYHVLTSVALWDKPALNRSILVEGAKVEKSAIRKDWRTERRSAFNSARLASDALRDIVENADCRFLLMSYSTDGNIPVADALAILANVGRLSLEIQPYKRYRVSAQRMSQRSHNAEFVAAVDMDAKPNPDSVPRLVESVLNVEEAALARSNTAEAGEQNSLWE
jgi:adenine-specific DNA-methyltransferase